MQFFPCGADATFECYAPERADATPTITIKGSGTGALVSAQSMTRDTVSTTTVEGVAPGAVAVRVADAGDCAAGRYYRVGPLREKVRVARVQGTLIELQFPLQHAYEAGVAFVGTRLTYAMDGDTFATPGSDFVARVSWLVGATARTPMDFGFAISRHTLSAPRPFHADIGICDVLEVLPALPAHLSWGTSWSALLARAEERVQANIEPHWKPWALRGQTSQYRECVLMRVIMEAAAQMQGDTSEREYWAQRYKETLDQMLASSNVDQDQDDAIESNEGGLTSIPIVRS